MSIAIIIAGTKGFADYGMIKETVLKYLGEHYINIDDVEIITGDAPGASYFGAQFAREYRLALCQFYAMPEAYGEAADWVRNEQMAEYAADRHGIVFAFWDGKSHGTKTMLQLARRHNLEVHTLLYEGVPLTPDKMLEINAVVGARPVQTNTADDFNELYDLDPSIRST